MCVPASLYCVSKILLGVLQYFHFLSGCFGHELRNALSMLRQVTWRQLTAAAFTAPLACHAGMGSHPSGTVPDGGAGKVHRVHCFLAPFQTVHRENPRRGWCRAMCFLSRACSVGNLPSLALSGGLHLDLGLRCAWSGKEKAHRQVPRGCGSAGRGLATGVTVSFRSLHFEAFVLEQVRWVLRFSVRRASRTYTRGRDTQNVSISCIGRTTKRQSVAEGYGIHVEVLVLGGYQAKDSGGTRKTNEVWASADGASWVQRPSAPWPVRTRSARQPRLALPRNAKPIASCHHRWAFDLSTIDNYYRRLRVFQGVLGCS